MYHIVCIARTRSFAYKSGKKIRDNNINHPNDRNIKQ